ncbi:hypothetical protein [Cupriavidus pinatubonensis]|uniref:Uncharacterized protein n=1 Tax=Cupriavidus pinatubonensis TaxID=248026 RepID=A0ABM8XZ98_9BURK|nr:hypothetical protein [Cupriavidus pinatubonensis]CAG9185729.1 hypothetical protein LMG23994_05857 [Cupriavidus pinatubonensis]
MQEKQKSVAMYPLATIDARTQLGGRVTRVSSLAEIYVKGVALFGDVVPGLFDPTRTPGKWAETSHD